MAADDDFPTAVVVLFTCVYILIFLSSVVGNSIVLSVCCKKVERRTSYLKWFIANLAVADLIFTTLTILDLIGFLWTWVGGQVSCKFQSFLVEACYTSSIMTLTLISYERHKAVVEPFNARRIAPENTHRKLIAVWIVSVLVGFPLLFAYRVEQDGSDTITCNNTAFGNLGRQIYYGLHAVCFFLVPLTYMIYAQISIFLTLRSGVFPMQNNLTATTACSDRRLHRKVAKTLAALTLAFVTCWSPFIVVRTLKYFSLTVEGYVWKASQLLILLNTALDPILYGIYGGNLKPFIQRLFRCTKFGSSIRVENISLGELQGGVNWDHTMRQDGKKTWSPLIHRQMEKYMFHELSRR